MIGMQYCFLLIFSVAMTAWNIKLRNCNALWTNLCSKLYKKQSYCKFDPEGYTWIAILSVELPAKLFNCVGRQVMEWGESSSRQWVSITMKCMWRLQVEEQEAQGTLHQVVDGEHIVGASDASAPKTQKSTTKKRLASWIDSFRSFLSQPTPYL
jgi:hypothetical protein